MIESEGAGVGAAGTAGDWGSTGDGCPGLCLSCPPWYACAAPGRDLTYLSGRMLVRAVQVSIEEWHGKGTQVLGDRDTGANECQRPQGIQEILQVYLLLPKPSS